MDTPTQSNALTTAQVGRNLIYAGLFLLAAELIGDLVVSRVRSFYAHTTFTSGPFESYEADVRVRHKKVFEASLFWLRDHLQVLTSEQVLDILAVRAHRNVLAHELSARIASLDPSENERLLTRARDVLFSLSNTWTRMEIGADPALQAIDVDWTNVHADDLTLLEVVIQKTRNLRNAKNQNDG